ncbi:unnamed protein product [Haemonchus placei]|uniref:WH2 domain-containing protein n=1 Tax=Haemonchus placei TaxID=6290 RepID=A0A3P7WML8_HAEPC|nr:unnamed protein product [Haemonchus placei]
MAQPTAEMPKSKKKGAAPTPPEPEPNATPVNESTGKPVESAVEEDVNSGKEDLDKQLEEKSTMSKEKLQTNPFTDVEFDPLSFRVPDAHQTVVHDVIHYSPEGTVRTPTFSPTPHKSDVPFVERKSNIILNDKTGYKTIRVTQFDGSVDRTVDKKMMESTSPESSPLPSAIRSKFEESRPPDQVPMKKKPSQEELFLLTTEDIGELRRAAEITQDYGALKAKFELWQALQSRNRNSPEARQLHMELIHQHDSLMKKLQQVTDTAVPMAKKRPSIASDTFSPWYSVTSSHSLSPTTSTSSEGTERSVIVSKTSRSTATGHSVSPNIRRTEVAREKHQPFSRPQIFTEEVISREEERERALQRIIEEAKELKRKEHELREANGTVTSASKRPAVHTPTPRRAEPPSSQKSPRTDARTTRTHVQKVAHQIQSSDGNNNSIRNRTSTPISSLATLKRDTPTVFPVRPLVQNRHHYPPVKAIHTNEIVYETWSGSRSGHLPRSQPFKTPPPQKHEKSKTSRPALPPFTASSPSLAGQAVNKESLTVGRKINTSSSALHPQISQTSAASIKPTPAKLPLAALRALSSETSESSPSPLSPDVESNIRKVKESVKQQTLSRKAANEILLKSQSESSSIAVATAESSATSGNSPIVRVGENGTSIFVRSTSENGETTNNIANMLKQGLPALKKVGTPVEKGGIVLGKVLDSSTENAVFQQETVFAQLPPLTPPPPPPPPPPPTLFASCSRPPSNPIPRRQPAPQSLPHSTSLISMRDLERQKTKLKPAVVTEKPVVPMDVRDSLMAEIRNAGGIRALRRTPRM